MFVYRCVVIFRFFSFSFLPGTIFALLFSLPRTCITSYVRVIVTQIQSHIRSRLSGLLPTSVRAFINTFVQRLLQPRLASTSRLHPVLHLQRVTYDVNSANDSKRPGLPFHACTIATPRGAFTIITAPTV